MNGSSSRGTIAKTEGRIVRMLNRLDTVPSPEDMNIPGYKFHQLSDDCKGTYVVTGNWRITFRFEGDDAVDVDLEDHH